MVLPYSPTYQIVTQHALKELGVEEGLRNKIAAKTPAPLLYSAMFQLRSLLSRGKVSKKAASLYLTDYISRKKRTPIFGI